MIVSASVVAAVADSVQGFLGYLPGQMNLRVMGIQEEHLVHTLE